MILEILKYYEEYFRFSIPIFYTSTNRGCKIYSHCSKNYACLLYTSDAADERSSVDLGGRRIIKKKKEFKYCIDTFLYKIKKSMNKQE